MLMAGNLVVFFADSIMVYMRTHYHMPCMLRAQQYMHTNGSKVEISETLPSCCMFSVQFHLL